MAVAVFRVLDDLEEFGADLLESQRHAELRRRALRPGAIIRVGRSAVKHADEMQRLDRNPLFGQQPNREHAVEPAGKQRNRLGHGNPKRRKQV